MSIPIVTCYLQVTLPDAAKYSRFIPRRSRPSTSPLADALARVGDRWTLLVVAALLDGPRRFNELQDELEGIAPNVLSARLKALGEQALVVAQLYSERPPRFVYELSESGRELAGALRLLADWGARSGGGEPYRHDACGTALEARWWCPSCEQIVDDPAGGDELVHV
jgi:DNA-binding HxlR family transcriptional regulator